MIKLYQFARVPDVPNFSHFCTKVETYLKLSRLPYQVVATLPMKAPKGKLPYIEDQGRIIADSRLIIEYLKQRYGDTLDGKLDKTEKAVALGMQRLIEEHFFWVTMYTRWQSSEANWRENKQAIFGLLPPVIRDVAAAVYRALIKRQIYGHGLGRLTWDEILELGKADVDAMANLLNDKPYMLGAQPSSLDASAFGFLTNTINVPIESDIKNYIRSKANLVRYCDRITEEFFPEIRERALGH